MTNSTRELSNCCKAQIRYITGDEGTGHMVCVRCNRPYDMYVEPTQGKKTDWEKIFRNIIHKHNRNCKPFMEIPEKVENKLVNLVDSFIKQEVEKEHILCKKIYLENVDWDEWAISDSQASEDFQDYYEQIKSTRQEEKE